VLLTPSPVRLRQIGKMSPAQRYIAAEIAASGNLLSKVENASCAEKLNRGSTQAEIGG
jgi:hypothetical protein